jgi:quinohemoprotein ethanol dehydrogenase
LTTGVVISIAAAGKIGRISQKFSRTPAVARKGAAAGLRQVPDRQPALRRRIRSEGRCGMPDFTGKPNDEDVVKIQAFIQGTADAVCPK